MTMKLFNRFKTDVGVDLGTANSLVYLKGEGIIINEPTIIALNKKTNQALAVGHEAKRMLGRTPQHVEVIRPLVNGVISDFLMTQEVLKHFLTRVKKDSLFRYVRAVVAVPANLTEVERKSVEDAVVSSGASSAYLLEEPVAAAIGAGLPTDEPTASMMVDIGGGTTEIAIISMGGVVVSRSLKVAGDKMDEDIMRFIKEDFKMAIGEATAEAVKMSIGAALPMEKKSEMSIFGRDLSSGLPKEVVIKDSQVRIALTPALKKIAEAVKTTIEETPPELAGDILKRGVYLSGGGGMLRGLADYLSSELAVKTILVDDPLTCVARGTGIAIESIDRYQDLFSATLKPMHLQ